MLVIAIDLFFLNVILGNFLLSIKEVKIKFMKLVACLLEDWLEIPCPSCGSKNYDRRVYEVYKKISTTCEYESLIRCPDCGVSHEGEYGYPVSADQMLKRGYKKSSETTVKKIVDELNRTNTYLYDFTRPTFDVGKVIS